MAWNQSRIQNGKRKIENGGKSSVLNSRFAVAAIIILVVAGGVAWWAFRAREETTRPDDGRRGPAMIAEAKPNIATNVVVEVPKPKPVDPNARPTKIGEVVNGYVMLPSGRIHRQLGVVTNSIAARPKGKYAIFSRSCNNEIACYLTLKPGDMLFGSIRHDGRFKQDFIESINEPIIVTKDDAPEVAQLKKDVIEARLHLKDAMDRGEDIEKIMQDTRQELQDMMRFKLDYERLFREEMKSCKTDQDVEDLFAACNKKLEERGIAPLTYGPITRKNILRQKANEHF